MTGLVLLLVGVLGQWLLGVVIASLMLRGFSGRRHAEADPSYSDQPTATELAGLGLIVGIGGTAGILFLWSLCGGSLGPGISIAITTVGLVSGGFVILLERRRDRANSNQVNDHLNADDRSQVRSWCRVCQIAIACLFTGTLVQTLMTPQHLWDERASFAIKGIVAWEDHSIDSRDLADPNFVQYHPRYPLLIPLAELHVYSLLGTVNDRLSKIIFPLLYLGMVLTVAGSLQRQFTPSTAWLFGLLTATIPSLVPWEYGFVCGQADAPTACYHGTSVLYLWIAWQQISRENPTGWFRSALMAGLCGAFAAFTKDEGISYLLVDGVAMLLVTLISRHRALACRIIAYSMGIAAVLLTPWFLHRRGLPLTTEANYAGRISLSAILENRANIEWEVPHLARRMFWEFRTWGLQWWLLVFGIVAAPRRSMSAAQLLLLLDVIGSLLGLMLAGILAETEVSDHIGGSSHRYLMQLAPVAVLFAAGQFGQYRESLARSSLSVPSPEE